MTDRRSTNYIPAPQHGAGATVTYENPHIGSGSKSGRGSRGASALASVAGSPNVGIAGQPSAGAGVGNAIGTEQQVGALAGGIDSPVAQQGGGAFSSGIGGVNNNLGFRDIPGYLPADESTVPQLPSVPAANQAVAEALTDENPYDDDDQVGPQYTYEDYTSGNLGGGTLDTTGGFNYGGGYDTDTGTFGTNYEGPNTAAARGAAARGLGYSAGTPNVAAGVGSILGAATGIPFLGQAAGALQSQIPGAPYAGDPGTISQSGGIYGQDGGSYDPISGQRIRGEFGTAASRGDIFSAATSPFTGGDDPFAPTATAAGIKNLPYERALQDQYSRPYDPGVGFASVSNPTGQLQPFGPTRGGAAWLEGGTTSRPGGLQGNVPTPGFLGQGPAPFTGLGGRFAPTAQQQVLSGPLQGPQTAQQLFTGEAPAPQAGPRVSPGVQAARQQAAQTGSYTSSSNTQYSGEVAANKAAADREAEEQTGVRGASAVTSSDGTPVRSSTGSVVVSESSVSDSGQDDDSSGGK